ncbi:hypothetical protein [Rhodocyclus tenuis]|uniref:Uncharacterized protein YggT (Ycf19 family) n=1 Tax=Rhodocyclus tenuis TaxID=1066 RepID=A0A840G7V5_RHOTE|nr:hypothetical protein [Rhodocyclus tenuis]MBB4247030.1 uncharacterized protein YggT (Ycf19 family) [Rhodocyclus tenuis]MBK1679504.1 hypothetical protein [Rhodocyclus tenuis]
MHLEIFLLGILRALVEVAVLSLLAQGVVGLLAGTARHDNPVYRVFAIITRPALGAIRFLTPRLIRDEHVPLLAFFLLFCLWILLAYLKRTLCLANGLIC